MLASTEGTVNASQLAAEKKRFSLCCFEREFVAPGSAGAQRVRYGGDARRTKNLSGDHVQSTPSAVRNLVRAIAANSNSATVKCRRTAT